MAYLSRAKRFAKAIESVTYHEESSVEDLHSNCESAKADVEELKEELENWKENLPENLQQGSKADSLDEAISELEQCIDNLDNAIATDDKEEIENYIEEAQGSSPDFPSMFG